jgi:hypothetical protein
MVDQGFGGLETLRKDILYDLFCSASTGLVLTISMMQAVALMEE